MPEGTGSVNPLPGSSSAWRAGRQQGRAVEQQEGSWGSVSTALRKSVFRCDAAKGPAGWASVLAVSSECRPRPRPVPWPGVLTGHQAFSFLKHLLSTCGGNGKDRGPGAAFTVPRVLWARRFTEALSSRLREAHRAQGRAWNRAGP